MFEILLALSLRLLITAALFDITINIENLSKQQDVLTDMQDNLRFMHFYLRRKIHEAGNWSCLSHQPDVAMPIAEKLSIDEAKQRFGISAVVNSDVLLLRECVRVAGHRVYSPVLFFLGDTHQYNDRHKKIVGLFMKIDHHPREALFSGISVFQVAVSASLADVVIHYVLQSEQPIFQVLNKPYFNLAGALYADVKVS